MAESTKTVTIRTCDFFQPRDVSEEDSCTPEIVMAQCLFCEKDFCMSHGVMYRRDVPFEYGKFPSPHFIGVCNSELGRLPERVREEL